MSRPEHLPRRARGRAAAGKQAMLAIACVVAAASLAIGVWREAKNPRFAVNLVAVRGLTHTSEQDVVAAAALRADQNAWLIDRQAMAQRIEALPWVERATLDVGWPNRLTIDVAERTPAAHVVLAPAAGHAADVRYALIDDSQRVLMPDEAAASADQLPVIQVAPPPALAAAGTSLGRLDIDQALDAYRNLRALGLQVSQVAIAPSTGISATADRNLRVLFGDDEDLAKKAALFQAIVAKISTPSRIAYVDVRAIRAPTVLYR